MLPTAGKIFAKTSAPYLLNRGKQAVLELDARARSCARSSISSLYAAANIDPANATPR